MRYLSDYVVVAAKIPKRLKTLMDSLGIKPGPLIRRSIEEEIRRKIFEQLEVKAKMLSEKLPPISDEEIAELIWEDRGR
ncbi:MAG: hypothetical protein QXJ62_02760 [Nitrososphaeria archaeon]|nr:hypothetical protein [Candidatus Verstraetearchaeota archaeon]